MRGVAVLKRVCRAKDGDEYTIRRPLQNEQNPRRVHDEGSDHRYTGGLFPWLGAAKINVRSNEGVVHAWARL